MALAMGHAGRRLHSFDGACCVSDPNGEGFAGTDLWIVSRVSAGDCGGLRGIGDAQGRGQSAAGEVGRRSRLGFFRPFGACCHLRFWTPACAVGCILSPPRGWARCSPDFPTFENSGFVPYRFNVTIAVNMERVDLAGMFRLRRNDRCAPSRLRSALTS